MENWKKWSSAKISNCHSEKNTFSSSKCIYANAICQWEDKKTRARNETFFRVNTVSAKRRWLWEIRKFLDVLVVITAVGAVVTDATVINYDTLLFNLFQSKGFDTYIHMWIELWMIRRLLRDLLWKQQGETKKNDIKTFDTCWWLFDCASKGVRIYNEP